MFHHDRNNFGELEAAVTAQDFPRAPPAGVTGLFHADLNR